MFQRITFKKTKILIATRHNKTRLHNDNLTINTETKQYKMHMNDVMRLWRKTPMNGKQRGKGGSCTS